MKTLKQRVDEFECQAIEQALAENEHKQYETAKALGISRVTLYNKRLKHGLIPGPLRVPQGNMDKYVLGGTNNARGNS